MLNSPAGANWLKVSPLEVLITRACEPSLPEPNYALHLEVADYINTKKANTPREGAMLIARLTNNRNPHVAILALALLDTLVQSCGYPFHLQVSTKEFLNELVRRFPERPPPFPGPVMTRILDLIHTWKETICVESRWKDDLKNIMDMERLLMFKGYRFRESHPRQPSAAAASNLKTAEELENEDRDAQAAKLQELIRRGTPRDLAAAQELMKALAGANPEAKPDYRNQALSELGKLESKVILLNEMLDNVDTARGERIVAGDVYEQVASILTAARPKIQKWISDAETHDSESLDTFLQINDQLNSSLARYEAYKKGDFATAANPIPAEVTDLSLIDFDDASSSANATGPPSSGIDDLAGLFSAAPPIPARQSSSMPPTYAPSPMSPSNIVIPSNNLASLMRTSSLSPPVPTNTPPAAIMLPSTPGLRSPGPANNRTFSPSQHPHPYTASQSVYTPQQPLSPQQPQAAPPQQQQQQGKDPFADLVGLF